MDYGRLSMPLGEAIFTQRSIRRSISAFTTRRAGSPSNHATDRFIPSAKLTRGR